MYFIRDFLKKIAEAVAEVDYDTALVRLDEDIIDRSIEQIGKNFILYRRDKNKVARFGYGDRNFLSTASQMTLIDPINRKRYIPTIKDVQDCIRVADALDDIERVRPFASTSDIPEYIRGVRLYYLELIKNTTKPCHTFLKLLDCY